MYLLFWFVLEDAWAYLDWEASDYHLDFTTRAINQWKVAWHQACPYLLIQDQKHSKHPSQ